MDYTYIEISNHTTPQNNDDFVDQLEKMCKAFDTTIYDNENKLKSVDEVFKTITMACLKYHDSLIKKHLQKNK